MSGQAGAHPEGARRPERLWATPLEVGQPTRLSPFSRYAGDRFRWRGLECGRTMATLDSMRARGAPTPGPRHRKRGSDAAQG